MKHTLCLFFFFVCISVTAQTNDYQVTLGGIGPFKVDMSKKEAEKLLNQTIKTPLASKKDEPGMDTVKVKWKDTDLVMVFYNRYIDEKKSEISIYTISSSSVLLKTKSGISIGDEKMKVIETYLDYSMNLWKDYETDEKGEYKESKTKSTIMLMGSEGAYVIYFRFENNKLVSFSVTMNEGC
jgi:hypothetical protein